jgi:hypothetical protein
MTPAPRRFKDIHHHIAFRPDDIGPAAPLSHDALPNAPDCIILSRTDTAVTCEICGETARPGHCPTAEYGFRCDGCCEVCHPELRTMRMAAAAAISKVGDEEDDEVYA